MIEEILIVEHNCKDGDWVSCQGKPKYLLLSERMGNGETLEELGDKCHRIIEAKYGTTGRHKQLH